MNHFAPAADFGDAAGKVRGTTQFAFDVTLPWMLHGALLRSPHAHARIVAIDASAALALPGVRCVVTGDDLRDLADPFYGVAIRDQPLIAIDRVRYVGDPVAAVVAEDQATAYRASQLIDVTYEVLPALMSVAAALADDAPALFDAPSGGHPMVMGSACSGVAEPAKNVLYDFTFGYGDCDAWLARAAHIFADSFEISRINHFHLEPHVNLARWVGGRVEMWSNNQDPFLLRADLSRVFGIPVHAARVHTPAIGGGFGGKSYCKMEPLVALMARKAGAPVRLALTMDESLLTLVKHPGTLRLTTGVDEDGRLLARRAEIVLDGGAYADASVLVAAKTAFRIGGAYRWKALDARARIVRTTTIPSGSFRGFGGTQASWASERQMDMMARRLGEDPLTFRLKNLFDPGEPFVPADLGMDSDLAAGLEEVATRIGWRASRQPGRGLGLAVGLKDAGGTGNHAQAIVRVTQGGEIMVQAAVVDVGQRPDGALCRIAAEALGLPVRSASYADIDTDHSPPDNGTHVSCGTLITGRAVEAGALEARRQILQFAADRLGCAPDELTLDGWAVRHGNTLHPLEPMVRGYYGGIGWEFIGRGAFKEPYDAAAPLGAKNVSFMPCWSGAEVSVDRETGLVTIHKLVVGSDVGRVLNLMSCEGQIEGAAIQALGQAMFEQLRYAGDAPENATPLTYRVPRAADLPAAFESFVAEHRMGTGPDGVKGVGEAGMLGIAAAIANAIEDASGASLTTLPFSPEKVLDALG